MTELTPDEIRRIETSWKSDVDFKLDKLIRFASEYEEYLKLAIVREKDRAELRRAIIEKSLSALIWSAVLGAFGLLVLGVKSWLGLLK